MGGIQLQHGTLLVPENSTSPQHGRGSPPGETLSHSPAHPALGDRCVTGLSCGHNPIQADGPWPGPAHTGMMQAISPSIVYWGT